MITETVAMAVTSHMIAIWLEEVTGTEGKRRWRPWLIWTVPRPRVMEMPSIVANTLKRKLGVGSIAFLRNCLRNFFVMQIRTHFLPKQA